MKLFNKQNEKPISLYDCSLSFVSRFDMVTDEEEEEENKQNRVIILCFGGTRIFVFRFLSRVVFPLTMSMCMHVPADGRKRHTHTHVSTYTSERTIKKY